MIKNCCLPFKNLPDYQIGSPYMELTNFTHLVIYFILQYSIDSGPKTKESPPLQYGQKYKISFSTTAFNICANVLQIIHHDTLFICNLQFPYCRRGCFNVTDAGGFIQCTEVPC